MRIPVSKKYRAFRDLDRFSDEQCERYLAEALRSSPGWQRLAMRLGLVLGVIVAMVISMIVVGAIANAIHQLLVSKPSDNRVADLVFDAILVLGSFGAMFVVVVGAFLIRDRWLVKRIRRRLEGARCPACSYSLLGLAVQRDRDTGEHQVLCPECGSLVGMEGRDGLAAELRALSVPADGRSDA